MDQPIEAKRSLCPQVSIVLTTLNAERFLRECIDSCLAQTYADFELIVADGGSTDRTLGIVSEYTDQRIRVVHQENNEGKLAGAINIGLDAASGEYLTWMQADCRYVPTAIEEMVGALEGDSEAGQVCADFWEMNESGVVTKTITLPPPDSYLHALGDPGGVCFLIRRAVRETIGRHDHWAYPSQDYDYRMRIAQRYRTIRIERPLYYWRVHGSSLSTRLTWVTLARKDVAIRQKLGLSDRAQARKLLAKIDVSSAFECFQNARYQEVPRLLLFGLTRDLSYSRNRGVWSILAKSLYRSLTGTAPHSKSR